MRQYRLAVMRTQINLYASLVSVGSYCVVFDTVIEDLESVEFVDRPWGKGDNPKTAVGTYGVFIN